MSDSFAEETSIPQMGLNLLRRPRRNRRHASLRALVQETYVRTEDLIAPLFVISENKPEPVESMSGVERLPVDHLVRECAKLFQNGIKAVALFPRIESKFKDPMGTHSVDENNLLLTAIKAIKSEVPDIMIITDVALDPYTDHGHDGLVNDQGEVMNDETVIALSELALAEARAGADVVAPSDMMDGRVQAIREVLDSEGFTQTAILSYSSKFASAFYGPFRDAVGSGAKAGSGYLDKKTYQLNPANSREALLESMIDVEEGADMLMVKPAGAYLDIIQKVKAETLLPLAAYQVSGEYAMIQAAAQKGWLDLEATRDESLLAIKRAGADMILTYFAGEIAKATK